MSLSDVLSALSRALWRAPAAHRVQPGALDIDRLVVVGGLWRYRLRADRPAVELLRTATFVLYGVIAGVALAVLMVGRL